MPDSTVSLTQASEVSSSEFHSQCEGPLCYDFSRLDAYINQPHVRKELGVGDRKWEACNMDVNFDMQGVFTLSLLLEAHYHCLLLPACKLGK